MSTILVCGAGGFIGTHLVEKLKTQGHYVIGVDIKHSEYKKSVADEFHLIDLRDALSVNNCITGRIDEIYQLAADMGGAGYVFTGTNDTEILSNSALININVAHAAVQSKVKKVFYSSSACVYPQELQTTYSQNPLAEHMAYPANPDSEYGWEKIFGERLWLTFSKRYGFDVRVARLHNVFGPFGEWNNGREKAPAALCRKVALADPDVEIWGSGEQTRTFMHIDDCVDGILRLMDSDCDHPLNIGTTRMISINELTALIATIANKNIKIKNIAGPIGVNGRSSDNTLILNTLGWEPPDRLEEGLKITYDWIANEINKS